MMSESRPAAVRNWIDRKVRIQRIEELLEAPRKQGVILAVFHFGSPRLLPIVLSLRGLRTVTIGPPTLGLACDAPRPCFVVITRCRDAGLSISFPDSRSSASGPCSRACTTAPRRFVWQTHSRPRRPPARRRRRPAFSAGATQDFRTEQRVSQSGADCIHLTSWIGWLAAVSGARVIPVVILRRSDHGLDVILERPLRARGGDREAQSELNDSLYQVFVRRLLQFPEQWFPWRNAHQFPLHDAGRPGVLRSL